MSEITKTKDQKPKPKNRITWLLFALVIVFIYFFGLSIPLLGPDEPRYAQVAREMFQRNDWITPTLGGFDWFEKPALLYWLQIAAYKIFGVSEFAARFGSTLFGLGTVWSLWILGKAVQSSKFKVQSKEIEINSTNDFANWLALIAASSIGLIVFSRGASFDIILTFPITAALVAFFIFDRSIKNSGFTFYFLLFTFYFFIGIALIAKGLVGIVFPFAIVAFYYVLSWKLPSKTFLFSLFWGILLSLLVACLWYLPMYQANGWKFIDEFFIQHHFQRFTSNKYKHPQPFWFFFAILPLMTIPWLPFFLASIWNFLKELFHRKVAKSQSRKVANFSSSPLLLFSISWLLVPLVFFSVSGSKLPGYILPALPAALILTADYVYKFVQKGAKRELLVKIIAFATFAVIAVILQFFVLNFTRHETVKNLIETANAKGFYSERIVNLFSVSHNLEFYAAGRLVRDADGKLKRFDDFGVLLEDLKSVADGKILVIVPQKEVPSLLPENTRYQAEMLDENGESAIVLVKLKQ